MKLAHSLVGVLLVSLPFGARLQRPAQAPLPFALIGTVCLQDQYGNQYSFTVDPEHKYVFGDVTNNQGCAEQWPLTGSYTETPGGLLLELTAANPDGVFSSCVDTYKLKGIFPNFEWYYDSGWGSQPATWVACGTRVTANPSSGGTLGKP